MTLQKVTEQSIALAKLYFLKKEKLCNYLLI